MMRHHPKRYCRWFWSEPVPGGAFGSCRSGAHVFAIERRAGRGSDFWWGVSSAPSSSFVRIWKGKASIGVLKSRHNFKCNPISERGLYNLAITTAPKNRPVTSCVSSRVWFLANVDWSKGTAPDVQVEEPPEEHAVGQPFAELALRAHRVERNQQTRLQQVFGRHGGPAPLAYMRLKVGDSS